MDELARALGPAFAAGFAIQRLVEMFDPLLCKIESLKKSENKAIVFGLVSLVLGALLAIFTDIRVLQPLGVATAGLFGNIVDIVTTALVISAGTEGLNSVMKFMGYGKEDKKAAAASKAGGGNS